MKYTNIIGAALILFMTACESSDTKPINSSAVSVGFEDTVLALKETVDFVTIPIVINEDVARDGDIIVQVTMKSNNGGFELDKHIIITTETLRIPPELSSINFEVGLDVYTKAMDSGRKVEFQITDVKGASAGSNNTCRIDLIESNFVEGRYEIEGVSMIYDIRATGAARITTEDGTLDNVRLDYGIGASAIMKFREIRAEEEYEVLIEPFQFVGVYNSLNVYMTWMKASKEASDPDTMEVYGGFYYDRTQPIRAKFERKLEDGEEVSVIITVEDGFALLGNTENTYAWFNNYKPKATMTKD